MMRGLPRSNALGSAGLEPMATMALSKLTNCWPCSRLDAQSLRAFKITAPVNHLHAALFGEHGDAAGKFFNDGIFPGAQFVHIDLGRLER